MPTIQQVLDGEPPANSAPVRAVAVPGAAEHYSNGGYLLVAQLLEDVLDKPFSAVMQEAVFGPIGMTSSTFEQSLPEELAARAASPHGWDVDAWRESPGLVGEWHTHEVGMGGLWTTAPDLARFAAEVMRAYAGESSAIISQDMARRMLVPVAEGIPLQEPFDADQALGFSLLHLGQETWFIHFGGAFPGYISCLIAQPERGFGVAIMTNAWSGYELIWEILYSIFYAYGILPTTGQILGMGYSVLLFVSACAFWPVGPLIRRMRDQTRGRDQTDHAQDRLAKAVRVLLTLVALAILILSYLYRGPLGGCLIPDRARGEPPLAKALLGVFFATPIVLLVSTGLVWKNRSWSVLGRVQYTLVALGALVGVVLLRDLWGLMFWG
jgi:CubicO group peptidase (beta-lactamase class C family)